MFVSFVVVTMNREFSMILHDVSYPVFLKIPRCLYCLLILSIHRMQIWRTTRSAPGTSRMKARLVRLWCFVLTMLFQRNLASLSIWSLCFALCTHFCVPECHRKRVKSSTAEKVFFSSVISFVFNGKLKRRRQGVYDRRRNCLSSGSKILENE